MKRECLICKQCLCKCILSFFVYDKKEAIKCNHVCLDNLLATPIWEEVNEN